MYIYIYIYIYTYIVYSMVPIYTYIVCSMVPSNAFDLHSVRVTFLVAIHSRSPVKYRVRSSNVPFCTYTLEVVGKARHF